MIGWVYHNSVGAHKIDTVDYLQNDDDYRLLIKLLRDEGLCKFVSVYEEAPLCVQNVNYGKCKNGSEKNLVELLWAIAVLHDWHDDSYAFVGIAGEADHAHV